MTAQSVRMMKEARLLAWPWMAVMSAGILALVLRSLNLRWGPVNSDALTVLGFFVGIPLIAGLGLGAEFQYRTLGLSLAQPVERRAIWRSKILVMLAAVAPVGLLFYIGGYSQIAEMFQRNLWPPLMFLLITTASAFLLTLMARSTIGGLALQTINSILFWVVVWSTDYLRNHGRLSPIVITAMSATIVMYAAVMVWLGRRMFLRFQAVEGMQSVEAFLPGAAWVPAAVADWFRCRPSGVVLNLVRREFRLLRSVWPLTLLSVGAWVCLVTFHVVPIGDDKNKLGYLVVTAMISILIAVLSGVLSLGEEKNWGTHDWQLTLPVSPSLQWFVKLSIGILISVFCGAFLPMGVLFVTGRAAGNVSAYLPADLTWLWPLEMAAITFAAFWCACLVKGTVNAALLTFPACAAVFAGAPLGQFLAEAIARTMQRPLDWIISAVGPFEAVKLQREIGTLLWEPTFLFVALLVPVFGFALLQSHRMFREEASESKMRVLRKLSPLFSFALVASFALGILFQFAEQSWKREQAFAKEIHHALLNAQLTNTQGAQPIRITETHLAKSSPLSADTQRWLSHASIVILPGPQRVFSKAGWEGGFSMHLDQIEFSHPYSAVVRLNDHSTCVMNSGSNGSKKEWADGTRVSIFYVLCD